MASREELKAIKEKTSQAIIDAALLLSSEEGYASLSLRSVARKAGIAPTSFYRHFRDIDELGVAMVDQAKFVLNECFSKVQDQVVPLDIEINVTPLIIKQSIESWVRPFVKIFMGCVNNNKSLMQLFFQERTGSSEAMRDAISSGIHELSDRLVDELIFFNSKVEDQIKQVRLIAESMITLLRSSIMDMLVFQEKNREDIIEQVTLKLELLLMGTFFQKMIK